MPSPTSGRVPLSSEMITRGSRRNACALTLRALVQIHARSPDHTNQIGVR